MKLPLKNMTRSRVPDTEERENWRKELAAAHEKNLSAESLKLFVVRSGNEWFGINPASVVMADYFPDLHSIPHRPDSLLGAVNLRGVITLCFSLEKILNCSPGNKSSRPMLIALDYEGWRVSFRIEEAIGIISFDPNTMSRFHSDNTDIDPLHVKGFFILDGKNIAVLNIDRLFNTLKKAAS